VLLSGSAQDLTELQALLLRLKALHCMKNVRLMETAADKSLGPRAFISALKPIVTLTSSIRRRPRDELGKEDHGELAAARGMPPLRKLRYASLVLATVAWSGAAICSWIRGIETICARQVAELRRAASELRVQVTRQQSTAATLSAYGAEDDTTAEALVARVGVAARQSGMHLAQSRFIASPPAAQPAASAAPPANGAQNAAPAPPPADPGGVEFHLTGTYSALQRMMKTIGQSRSRFQVLTLDVLRAKVGEKTGIAQLDIRLICVL